MTWLLLIAGERQGLDLVHHKPYAATAEPVGNATVTAMTALFQQSIAVPP